MNLDQFLHFQGGLQGTVPFLLIELQGRTLLPPVVGGQGIIVQGHTVHEAVPMVKSSLQHFVRPVVVPGIGTTGNLVDGFAGIVIAHIGLVPAVQVAVVLRPHIAATAPVLIAHTEVIHPPGRFMAVGLAQICHGGDPFKGHILHPLAHLLDSAASHVAVDIGLAAKLPA